MTSERYVVLGLARPRAAWFGEITRWATSAALPVEFVKCLSPEEARARLASGRRWSAVLVDGGIHGVDRDLLEAALGAGTVPLVVDDPKVRRDWADLGAVAVLPADLGLDDLLRALAEHSRPVSRAAPTPVDAPTSSSPPWRGRLVAVTGAPGTGRSIVAAATAQGLAADASEQGMVVLADLDLHADQAVLHDVGDVVPGLSELVDAHRLGRLDPDEVRSLCFAADRHRRYDLLLGLRRHRDWTVLRPRAVEAALDGLLRTYRTVVADVGSDLEGERETGVAEIEDRNVLARTTIARADAILVVGRPDVVGAHHHARVIRDLVEHGVDPLRIAPVVNRAPRSPRLRAELTSTLAQLVGDDGATSVSPTFVGERRRLDEIVRAGGAWPGGPARQLAATVVAVDERARRQLDEPSRAADVPERIRPGSLGSYSDLESDAS